MKLNEAEYIDLQYRLMEVLQFVTEEENKLAEIRLMELLEDVKYSEVK